MKTIELIDKYIIQQHDDGDYNPPSYIWTDNTGVLTRCKECSFHDERTNKCVLIGIVMDERNYCSLAVRRADK